MTLVKSRMPSKRPRSHPSLPAIRAFADRNDLDIIHDNSGAVTFGWVAPRVIYTRFDGGFSAHIGYDYAMRLGTMLAQFQSLSFFGDATRLRSYDLLARSALVRAILTNRRKFAVLAMLTQRNGLAPAGGALAATFGEPIQVLTDAAAFEMRLLKAAPQAHQKLNAVAKILSGRWPAELATLRR